uniref:Venom prothrombin activator oscutarin-C non-catalytic subunit-like n=1 Tax=Cyprinus carpio TaxID=7962 RepID=A0A8C1N046_CYPCA
MKLCSWPGAPYGLAILAFLCNCATAVERRYYIAAVNINWDYTSAGQQRLFETNVLGLLGPTLRGQEGDTIIVTFKNMADHPCSLHPHGIAYGKQSEGSLYFDNTSLCEKEDDVILPGKEHTYQWEVTSEVTPTAADPPCITYTYLSHFDIVKDYNTGLIGPMLICKKGSLDDSGNQLHFHQEAVLLFGVFDENKSWYSTGGPEQAHKVKYTINGYTNGSVPDLDICAHSKVSWHLLGMSSEPELFSVHFNGQALVHDGHKTSSVGIISGTATSDMPLCEIHSNGLSHFYPLRDFRSKYLKQGPQRIGKKYKKAVFTQYKDGTFKERAEDKQRKKELGILGPVIRAQIRDVIKIVFKNKATRPYSIYPHGLTIDKNMCLNKIAVHLKGNQTHGIQPGENYTYTWSVSEEDTPTDSDPRCLTRMYHSAVDTPRDIASGLVGPLLICKSQSLNKKNVQLKADKEQHAMFTVFDENKSWYHDENINTYCSDPRRVKRDDPDVVDSYLVHVFIASTFAAINGYVYESGQELGFCNGEIVTWHVSSVGEQDYIQTATFYGHTFELKNREEDMLSLFPMTGETITMNMLNIGDITSSDAPVGDRNITMEGDSPSLNSSESNIMLSNQTLVNKTVIQEEANTKNNTDLADGDRDSSGHVFIYHVPIPDSLSNSSETQTEEDFVLLNGGLPSEVLTDYKTVEEYNVSPMDMSEEIGELTENTTRIQELNSTKVNYTGEMFSQINSETESIFNLSLSSPLRNGTLQSNESESSNATLSDFSLDLESEITENRTSPTNVTTKSHSEILRNASELFSSDSTENMSFSLGPFNVSSTKNGLESESEEEVHEYMNLKEYNPFVKSLLCLQRRVDKSSQNERTTSFKKAVFRKYLDSTFSIRDIRGEMDEHLGILGPVIKAEVDQTVFFRNLASRPYSLHANGVKYLKQMEGLSYDDQSPYWYKQDDAVQPNSTFIYMWTINSKSGPQNNESDCRTWTYYSAVNPERDINSGLIGPLLVCRKGTLDQKPLGRREFVLLFMTFDESKSWYYEENRERIERKNKRAVMDPNFKNNLKFDAFNGIIYSLKGLRMYTNQLAKWHLINMGSPKDLHSVHFHGQTFINKELKDHRQGVYPLLPGGFATLEMLPSKPGLWQLESEVGLSQQRGMQTLFLVLDNVCDHPLGVISGTVKDEHMSASDSRGQWYPHLARLHNTGKYNAWSTTKRGQHIQVDFQRPVVISKVATQGAKQFLSHNFVLNYTISYSTDKKKWTFYKGDSDTVRKASDYFCTFEGNSEAYDTKENIFFPPLIGRYVRLYPLHSYNYPTVRLEYYGCELDGCSVPLGMESGLIKDAQITASSVASNWYSGQWHPWYARLNKLGTVNAWQAKNNDMQPWIQVELKDIKKITGIITQGAKSFGNEMFVTAYTLEYSEDSKRWTKYTEDEDYEQKTFRGNTDNNGQVKNYIYPPIFSKFIRIIPKQWQKSITMRIELLGCDFE